MGWHDELRLLAAVGIGSLLLASAIAGEEVGGNASLDQVGCEDWSIEAAIDRAIAEEGGQRWGPLSRGNGSAVEAAGSGQSSGLELDVRPVGDPEGDWGLEVSGFSFLRLEEATLAAVPLSGARLADGEDEERTLAFPWEPAPEDVWADNVSTVDWIVRFAPLECSSSVLLSFELDGGPSFGLNNDFEVVLLDSSIRLDDPEARRAFTPNAVLDSVYGWGDWKVVVYRLAYFNGTHAYTNGSPGPAQAVDLDAVAQLRAELESVPPVRLEGFDGWWEGTYPYPPYFTDQNGTRYYHTGV